MRSITVIEDENMEVLASQARFGCTESLDKVIRYTYKQTYGLALRFLSKPQNAEDACQEIAIKVMRNITSFNGESKFSTWLYRVAWNTLISTKKRQKDNHHISFDDFAEGVAEGMDDHDVAEKNSPDYHQMLQEIRVSCTLAMLQCLDDDSRIAYILGEIFDLDHQEASEVLSISPDGFRKRLSRARQSVLTFMSNTCGIISESNRCRCSSQVSKCISKACINRKNLEFSKSEEEASRFQDVLTKISAMDKPQRVITLFREAQNVEPSVQFYNWLEKTLTQDTEEEMIV